MDKVNRHLLTATTSARMHRAMPPKDVTKTPGKQIDRFIRCHLAGESVTALAREYRVSRAGAYLWLKKHREEVLARSMRVGTTAKSRDKAEKVSLRAENAQLKRENAQLRDKVVSLMVKAGEI
jgi:transposase-like protein